MAMRDGRHYTCPMLLQAANAKVMDDVMFLKVSQKRISSYDAGFFG